MVKMETEQLAQMPHKSNTFIEFSLAGSPCPSLKLDPNLRVLIMMSLFLIMISLYKASSIVDYAHSCREIYKPPGSSPLELKWHTIMIRDPVVHVRCLIKDSVRASQDCNNDRQPRRRFQEICSEPPVRTIFGYGNSSRTRWRAQWLNRSCFPCALCHTSPHRYLIATFLVNCQAGPYISTVCLYLRRWLGVERGPTVSGASTDKHKYLIHLHTTVLPLGLERTLFLKWISLAYGSKGSSETPLSFPTQRLQRLHKLCVRLHLLNTLCLLLYLWIVFWDPYRSSPKAKDGALINTKMSETNGVKDFQPPPMNVDWALWGSVDGAAYAAPPVRYNVPSPASRGRCVSLTPGLRTEPAREAKESEGSTESSDSVEGTSEAEGGGGRRGLQERPRSRKAPQRIRKLNDENKELAANLKNAMEANRAQSRPSKSGPPSHKKKLPSEAVLEKWSPGEDGGAAKGGGRGAKQEDPLFKKLAADPSNKAATEGSVANLLNSVSSSSAPLPPPSAALLEGDVGEDEDEGDDVEKAPRTKHEVEPSRSVPQRGQNFGQIMDEPIELDKEGQRVLKLIAEKKANGEDGVVEDEATLKKAPGRGSKCPQSRRSDRRRLRVTPSMAKRMPGKKPRRLRKNTMIPLVTRVSHRVNSTTLHILKHLDSNDSKGIVKMVIGHISDIAALVHDTGAPSTLGPLAQLWLQVHGNVGQIPHRR
ncbi:hypothetical protein EV356DRAFT_513038 [Viridothelium virens]|uniref:Uncharacterized protein n=1 Tax=Viridothelium virens TaxID=1048519 RepID=A0A6A6HEC7_VIRVR|nr:hypothetical protein EV356DRAFT_513038 [Viridothelium virens]